MTGEDGAGGWREFGAYSMPPLLMAGLTPPSTTYLSMVTQTRMTLHPGERREGAGERHRDHLRSADEIEFVVLQRLIGQFGKQRRPLGVEHGRLQVEIEIALAARCESDLAAAERALADDVGET